MSSQPVSREPDAAAETTAGDVNDEEARAKTEADCQNKRGK